MRVVYEPAPLHVCNPGWDIIDIPEKFDDSFGETYDAGTYFKPIEATIGTVVECECSRTYICTGPNINLGMALNQWRAESKWERFWRTQHQARLARKQSRNPKRQVSAD